MYSCAMSTLVSRPRIIALLIAVSVLAMVGIYLEQGRDEGARAYFSRVLSERGIQESVLYAGTTYDVGKGRNYAYPAYVLGLAYEKASARYAPFVALPGVDIDAFLAAVEELEAVKAELADTQPDAQKAASASAGLYPIEFLHSMAELETARRAFLESGDERDAYQYRRTQFETLSEYGRAIRTFRKGFLASVPEDVGMYVTDTRIVSRESVLGALDKLESGARVVSYDMRERTRCSQGHISSCTARDLVLPEIDLAAHATKPVSNEALALAEVSRDIYEDSGSDVEPQGAMFLLSRSSCVQEKYGSALLYAFERNRYPGNPGFQSAFYIGDILAIRLQPNAKLPFFRYFAENGAELLPARPQKYYRCPESGRDAAMLFAIANVSKFAKDRTVSAYVPDTSREKLRRLEEDLAESVVREDAAAAYLQAATTDEVLSSVDDKLRNDLITLRLEFAYQGLGTYHDMLDIIHSEVTNAYLVQKGIEIDRGALYLFFARSGFVSLLFGHDVSVTGPHPDFFAPNTLRDEETPTVRFSSTPITPQVRRDLVRDFTLYADVHELPRE